MCYDTIHVCNLLNYYNVHAVEGAPGGGKESTASFFLLNQLSLS